MGKRVLTSASPKPSTPKPSPHLWLAPRPALTPGKNRFLQGAADQAFVRSFGGRSSGGLKATGKPQPPPGTQGRRSCFPTPPLAPGLERRFVGVPLLGSPRVLRSLGTGTIAVRAPNPPTAGPARPTHPGRRLRAAPWRPAPPPAPRPRVSPCRGEPRAGSRCPAARAPPGARAGSAAATRLRAAAAAASLCGGGAGPQRSGPHRPRRHGPRGGSAAVAREDPRPPLSPSPGRLAQPGLCTDTPGTPMPRRALPVGSPGRPSLRRPHGATEGASVGPRLSSRPAPRLSLEPGGRAAPAT